jgi:ribosomal protein S20
MDNSPKHLFKIGQLEASLRNLAYDDIFLKERDPKKREQYIKNIIDTSTNAAEDYARRINLKENTMKKSELKTLIKDIIKEMHGDDEHYDIETSKGKFRLIWQDDSDGDSTGTLYSAVGPDGKLYSVDSNDASLDGIKKWIETSNKIPHNTMKKSELKELLKVIAEEVIAIKKSKLDETKGLSGFKKAKESTDHTENVADSKSLTPTSEPKEKKEGKKLPVVKKPANPQKVGSLKEEILKMIREEIDEMARVKGAVGNKFKVEDPNSPTGWAVKGHKTIPDGTPTEAPKGSYQKTGTNPNLGRPKTSPVVSTGTGSQAEIARTEEAVAEFVKYNPNATEQEVIDAIAEKNSEETPLSMDAKVIQTAIEKAKADAGTETDTSEPDIANLAASEKADKQAKMNRLRQYLLKKKGLK